MNKPAEKISDSELEIMGVLWDAGVPLPLTEIRVALQEKTGWEHSTIKTLLHRLHQKGAVTQEKRNVYYYYPAVSQAEYSDYTTQALIDKLYRGSARNLLVSLVSSKKLRQEDIEEIRSLLMEDEANE